MCTVVVIHVDDLFISGSQVFKDQVLLKLKKDFQVGLEDINDVLFVGQRIRWLNKGTKDAVLQVDQERNMEELTEVVFDSSLRDDIICTRELHTSYRNVLGQINWLQSRTQWKSC